jgi:hypothetical protein
MLQDMQNIESDPTKSVPAAAAEPRQPSQPVKAASLTGALVQRGRDRAPRLPSVPLMPVPLPAEPAPTPTPLTAPAPAAEFAPVSEEVPLVFAKPRRKAEPAPRPSRWSEALFVAACCAAFFATFLFVLRF